jgi:hypothetical protein
MHRRRSFGLRAFAAKLRGLAGGHSEGDEFDAEVREHLRLLAERYVAQGMSREEAAVAARRQFGNTTLLHEERQALQSLPAIATAGFLVNLFTPIPALAAVGIAAGMASVAPKQVEPDRADFMHQLCHLCQTTEIAQGHPSRLEGRYPMAYVRLDLLIDVKSEFVVA